MRLFTLLLLSVWALSLEAAPSTKKYEDVRKFLIELRSLYGSKDEKKIGEYMGKTLGASELPKKLANAKVPKLKTLKFIQVKSVKDQIHVRWYSDSTPLRLRQKAPWFILSKGGKHKFRLEEISEIPERPKQSAHKHGHSTEH